MHFSKVFLSLFVLTLGATAIPVPAPMPSSGASHGHSSSTSTQHTGTTQNTGSTDTSMGVHNQHQQAAAAQHQQAQNVQHQVQQLPQHWQAPAAPNPVNLQPLNVQQPPHHGTTGGNHHPCDCTGSGCKCTILKRGLEVTLLTRSPEPLHLDGIVHAVEHFL